MPRIGALLTQCLSGTRTFIRVPGNRAFAVIRDLYTSLMSSTLSTIMLATSARTTFEGEMSAEMTEGPSPLLHGARFHERRDARAVDAPIRQHLF